MCCRAPDSAAHTEERAWVAATNGCPLHNMAVVLGIDRRVLRRLGTMGYGWVVRCCGNSSS